MQSLVEQVATRSSRVGLGPCPDFRAVVLAVVGLQFRTWCYAPAHRRPLEAVKAAAVEVVLPIFRAMVEGAEAAVLDMHSQQWDAAQSPGDGGRGAVSASRYMDALTRRLTHYRRVSSISTPGCSPSQLACDPASAYTPLLSGCVVDVSSGHGISISTSSRPLPTVAHVTT